MLLKSAEIVAFFREEENGHITQLFADISSDFARIARYMTKVGFSLTDEWKSADHLVLNVREYKTRMLAIHIRATGSHDNQSVDVSHTFLRRRETKPVSFSLPDEFAEAKFHVLAELFSAFPTDRLLVKAENGEVRSMFMTEADRPPAPTWDEGVIKQRAVAQAEQEGLGKMICSAYADDNLPARSFAKR